REASLYAAMDNNTNIISQRLQSISNADTTAPDTTSHLPSKSPDSKSTPTATPPESRTTIVGSPPIIVINFLRNGSNISKDEEQTVDFPDTLLNATILDMESELSKLTIELNNKTVVSKNISGKLFQLEDEKIKLTDKSNRIRLIAHNRNGLKTVSREITLTYRKELLKGLEAHELVKHVFGKKRSWAVIIGIDQYTKTKNGYIPLPYAVNDAKAVRECFIKSLGFAENHIITLTNRQATRKRIVEVLGDELPKKAGKDDRVIIYFSGHGDQEKVIDGRIGYLVPIDGEKDFLNSTCISMEKLKYISRKNPARQILFILDSCFSGIAGTVFKNGTDDTITKETRAQIEAFIQSGGRQIITAGKANQTAAMSEKWNKHSVFTYFLLRGLRGKADYNKDKVVSVRELQVYLESEVPKESKQLPQLFNLNNSEGQFVFYREDAY
ncbi:MAG: caspase family protein, partial [bacterium]|nr:caspase family protein [bacterium]